MLISSPVDAGTGDCMEISGRTAAAEEEGTGIPDQGSMIYMRLWDHNVGSSRQKIIKDYKIDFSPEIGGRGPGESWRVEAAAAAAAAGGRY